MQVHLNYIPLLPSDVKGVSTVGMHSHHKTIIRDLSLLALDMPNKMLDLVEKCMRLKYLAYHIPE